MRMVFSPWFDIDIIKELSSISKFYSIAKLVYSSNTVDVRFGPKI